MARALAEASPKRPAALAPEKGEELWADLANEDACRAYTAVCADRDPGETVRLFADRLHPTADIDRQHVAHLLAKLDSQDFKVREQATRELEQAGDLVGPAVRKLLEENGPLEVRRRAEQVLAKLDREVPSAEELRVWRAIEVLEQSTIPRLKDRRDPGCWKPAAKVIGKRQASLSRWGRPLPRQP